MLIKQIVSTCEPLVRAVMSAAELTLLNLTFLPSKIFLILLLIWNAVFLHTQSKTDFVQKPT